LCQEKSGNPVAEFFDLMRSISEMKWDKHFSDWLFAQFIKITEHASIYS
jgi:hypothetical protein